MEQSIIDNLWNQFLNHSLTANNFKAMVLEGEVPVKRFEDAACGDDKLSEYLNNTLRPALSQADNEAWLRAKNSGKIGDYRIYLKAFGIAGKHATEAEEEIERMDEALWINIEKEPTIEKCNQYLEDFPDGMHFGECKTLLDDLPWILLEKKEDSTSADYENYKTLYPGKHDSECSSIINDLKAWEDADRKAHIEPFVAEIAIKAYESYLKIYGLGIPEYPSAPYIGRHAEDAKSRIANIRYDIDEIVTNLQKDKNYYYAVDLQKAVETNKTTWAKIQQVLGDDWTEKIKSYKGPSHLEKVENEETMGGFTEVYFWGVRATGKTCAIGAAIGHLRADDKYNIQCKAKGGSRRYYDQLQKLFRANSNNICELPDSTYNTSLPHLPITFNDDKGREHRVMLIDVPGEAFSAAYKKREGQDLLKTEITALTNLETQLKNKKNKKIFIFIEEYGSGVNDVIRIDGINEPPAKYSVMESLIQYISDNDAELAMNKVLTLAIVVTKCDRIEGYEKIKKAKEDEEDDEYKKLKEQEQKAVDDFTHNSEWKTVNVNLKNLMKIIGNREGKLMRAKPFTIGEVVAKNFCKFDPEYGSVIADLLIRYTPPYKRNILTILADILRS